MNLSLKHLPEAEFGKNWGWKVEEEACLSLLSVIKRVKWLNIFYCPFKADFVILS